MDNYIVSARKYRPATFQTLVGQSNLAQTLKNAINSNKLAHAYLFCGPRGVGKTSCARIFAKTINCFNPDKEGEACNECESCKSFNEQRSYNIHELDAASNNGVDNIKDLISQVMIPPQVGKYKIFIIDEVHMLSTAAFNAFLKTLEEPPRHVVFILATTEKHKILPTILSRCQIYDFNRITVAHIADHLAYVAKNENVSFEPAALNIIAQKADGGMRDALSIFDQVVSFTDGKLSYRSVIENLNVLDYEYYFRITDALVATNVTASLLVLNEIISKGFDAQHFINGLSAHLRNVMVCKDEATLALVEGGADLAARYSEQAKKCSERFLYKALELSNDCDLNYKASRNKRLLTEIALIKIAQINNPQNVPMQPQGMQKGNVGNGVPNMQPQQPQSNMVAEQRGSYNTNMPPQNGANNVSAQGYNQPASAPNQSAQDQRGANERQTDAVRNNIQPSAQQTATQAARPQVKADAGQPRRRVAMPDISIDLAPKKEKEKEAVQTYTEQRNEPVNPDNLLRFWREYTSRIPTKTILINTMKSCLPQIHNNTEIHVWVENPTQVNDLNEETADLIPYLRGALSNSFLRLFVHEKEKGENRKFLTPKEIYKEMVAENQDLVFLKDTFNLEMA